MDVCTINIFGFPVGSFNVSLNKRIKICYGPYGLIEWPHVGSDINEYDLCVLLKLPLCDLRPATMWTRVFYCHYTMVLFFIIIASENRAGQSS